MTIKFECLQSVVTLLKANLPAGFNPSRIKYSNGSFKTPKVSNTNAPIADCWLEIKMTDVAVVSESLCRQITRGVLSIDIYWPKMTGNQDACLFAIALQKLFANEWIESLKINLGLISEFENNDWYNINISFEYFYEESVK
jgi:hypothetical protein